MPAVTYLSLCLILFLYNHIDLNTSNPLAEVDNIKDCAINSSLGDQDRHGSIECSNELFRSLKNKNVEKMRFIGEFASEDKNQERLSEKCNLSCFSHKNIYIRRIIMQVYKLL